MKINANHLLPALLVAAGATLLWADDQTFEAGAGVSLPFDIYSDTVGKDWPYAPSGWMGNMGKLELETYARENPRSGEHCLKVSYTAPDGWCGVAFQHPENDWGSKPGGYDLTGATQLVLWARGEAGGEQVRFDVGQLKPFVPYHDTAIVSTGTNTLTKAWTRQVIPLAGEDLRRIKTGFVFIVPGQGRPVTFYLDDIRFE